MRFQFGKLGGITFILFLDKGSKEHVYSTYYLIHIVIDLILTTRDKRSIKKKINNK